MRIVTDGRGGYAIAKYRWIFTCYFDLVTPGFWWSKDSRFYGHCWGKKQDVLRWYGTLNPTNANDILKQEKNMDT